MRETLHIMVRNISTVEKIHRIFADLITRKYYLISRFTVAGKKLVVQLDLCDSFYHTFLEVIAGFY